MMRAAVRESLKPHLVRREGVRFKVYKDSRGFLTGGVGHLILKADGYKFGQEIPDATVWKWLEDDMVKAIKGAEENALELGRSSVDFLVALASVNFQLGTDWEKKFFTSWPALKRGDYQAAIRGFRKSAWAKQTPVRVDDFIQAIKKEYGKA